MYSRVQGWNVGVNWLVSVDGECWGQLVGHCVGCSSSQGSGVAEEVVMFRLYVFGKIDAGTSDGTAEEGGTVISTIPLDMK